MDMISSSFTINADRHRNSILTEFVEQLHDDELQNNYFQKDGVTGHTQEAISLLRVSFDDRLISLHTQIESPARPPVLVIALDGSGSSAELEFRTLLMERTSTLGMVENDYVITGSKRKQKHDESYNLKELNLTEKEEEGRKFTIKTLRVQEETKKISARSKKKYSEKGAA
ncbi:hypothetical protein Trydic_g11391 [Trypoxylus dichotomus]